MQTPSADLQARWWDDWNRRWRAGEPDAFMKRQAATALAVIAGLAPEGRPRVLDVGCGTGWLSAALAPIGDVTGIDIARDAVARARARYPEARFVEGDIAAADLDGPFDLVVAADVLAHVEDQPAFIRRAATLLRPGGVLLLMTQNPRVWTRVSYLSPRGEGQIRNWAATGRILEMLGGAFETTWVSSIAPAGNRGALAWVDPSIRIVRRGLGAPVVHRYQALLERFGLGRELVIVATRRRGEVPGE